MSKSVIAIGSRLKGIPEVSTLGVKPNFNDYSVEEKRMIFNAEIILYPTKIYAQLFTTLGKRIFPSLETYLYADEKIKQTTLFYMLGIPHPRTRFYYHLHHKEILNDFQFPFVAKLPRASSQGKGIFKITNPKELKAYLDLTHIAYIQEFFPHERDLRILLINYTPIIAYWRKSASDNFRTNLSQGGTLIFDDIPSHVIELSRKYAQMCKFNDVGLDFIEHHGQWYLIEANMKYGRKGLARKGMDLKGILRTKILSGELVSSQ